MRSDITASFLLIAALATSTAYAQPGPRTGVWFGGGIGVGHATIDCANCGPLFTDDPWEGGLGVAGTIAVGRTLTPQVLVGADLNVWTKRDSDLSRDATILSLGIGVRFYPIAAANFYVGAALGLGHSILGGEDGSIESPGFAAGASVGYDVPLGASLALSPFLKVVQIVGQGAEGRNRGLPADGPDNLNFVQIGIALMRF